MMTHSKPVFRALVVGFYGAPNVGDEVLLDLLVRRIRELGGEPVVASIDPSLTRRMHGVDAVQFANVGDIARALMHCDVLVMGAAASSRTIIPSTSMRCTSLMRTTFPAMHGRCCSRGNWECRQSYGGRGLGR